MKIVNKQQCTCINTLCKDCGMDFRIQENILTEEQEFKKEGIKNCEKYKKRIALLLEMYEGLKELEYEIIRKGYFKTKTFYSINKVKREVFDLLCNSFKF